MVLAALALVGLAGCTIRVNQPEDTSSRSASPTPSYAAPTILPGHDAAAVAAKDMTWAAGNTLSIGVPVGWNDHVPEVTSTGNETPPAEWKAARLNQGGWTEYQNVNSCTESHWFTVNQQPLMTAEDDLASTRALFHFLMPSVLPEVLKETTMRWGQDLSKPTPSVQFLSWRQNAAAGHPAILYNARMFNHAGTGLVFTLSCPTDALLDATYAALLNKLSVAPPGQ